jgi:ubiquinone biosynthesis protein
VAHTLVHLVLKSMFEDGFFHADPHPGNILLLGDGRLALLDYGQMGWLDRRRIHELSDLLVALAAGEAEQVTRSLLALGDAAGMVPEQRVVNQVRALMLRHFSPEAGLVELGPLVEKLLALALAQQVSVPAEMTLVVKCLMTVEEVVGRLDPQLQLDEEVRPFMRRLIMERLTPRHVSRSLGRYASEMGEMALALPRHAGEVARKLARGQLTTELRHIGLERLVDALEHGSNRVSFALVIAALIVGSSILTQAGLGPQLWGISSLGLVGFALAALMGVWLLVGIIRSGRL